MTRVSKGFQRASTIKFKEQESNGNTKENDSSRRSSAADFKGQAQRRGSNASLAFAAAVRANRGDSDNKKQVEFFEHNNGWQMKSERVLERVTNLFNCGTMSDVVFQVEGFEIPAHKVILGASSPVFYSRFYESNKERTIQSRRHARHFFGGMQKNGRSLIQIEDVPAAAFFEFLRFLYTDKLSVTLENVSSLMILADDFKVAGLTEVCMEYLSAMTSDPLAVLCILKILRNAFLKCIVCLWRDITESHKEMRLEAQLNEENKHSSSEASTRAPSSMSGHSLAPIGAGSSNSPVMPHSALKSSPGRPMSPSDMSRLGQTSFELSKQSRQMSYKLGQVVQELEVLCWRCIDKETEKVLACEDFGKQEINLVRAILARTCSSVPEIALFRAVNLWSTHQCTIKGILPTPENRRKLLGKEATQLLRFPAMTTQQIQREVVPTGLLEYADVHSLLRYKDGAAQLVRFSAQAREGFEEADLPTARRPSLEPLRPQRAVYEAVQEDPVDALLAAGLLRQHLRGGIKVPGVERTGVKNPLLRGCDTAYRVRSEEAAPKAEDFERLGPGHYRYKGKKLLRMKLENGEVMVYDTERSGSDFDAVEGDDIEEHTSSMMMDTVMMGRKHHQQYDEHHEQYSVEENTISSMMMGRRFSAKTSAKYSIPSKVRHTLGIPLVSFLEGELI